MESKLKCLFDFQLFEGNRALEEVISGVHARYTARELSLEDMEFASAAGVPENRPDKKKL